MFLSLSPVCLLFVLFVLFCLCYGERHYKCEAERKFYDRTQERGVEVLNGKEGRFVCLARRVFCAKRFHVCGRLVAHFRTRGPL